jgi:hypothetical protein
MKILFFNYSINSCIISLNIRGGNFHFDFVEFSMEKIVKYSITLSSQVV